MKIDAHQHFWRFNTQEYPSIDPDSPIGRDFLPPDLEPLLDAAAVDGSIVVQARQTLEESRWLLELADQHPRIKGVVGWVDLASERVEEQLVELSRNPRFVGVRHVVQDEPDDQFLVRPNFVRGLEKLKAFQIPYDLLIYPKQLPAAIELVQKLPDQPFILDHLAKPLIRDAVLSPWQEQIRELAEAPNVVCKVSGMVTEANWRHWRNEDFRPYLDTVFEAFGADRLMFGSDWPVCLLSATYGAVFKLVDQYTRHLSPESRQKVFGGTAVKVYGIIP